MVTVAEGGRVGTAAMSVATGARVTMAAAGKRLARVAVGWVEWEVATGPLVAKVEADS